MVCIGIYGDKTDGFTKQLLKRYFDAGISAAACTHGDCDRAYIVASAMGKDVFITNRCLWTDIKFDICVFFSWHENNNISIITETGKIYVFSLTKILLYVIIS